MKDFKIILLINFNYKEFILARSNIMQSLSESTESKDTYFFHQLYLNWTFLISHNVMPNYKS